MKGAWHAVAETPWTKRAFCAGERSDREGLRPLFSPALLWLNKYLPYGAVKSDHSSTARWLSHFASREDGGLHSPGPFISGTEGSGSRARKEGYLVHVIISTSWMRSIYSFWAQSGSQRIV